MGSLLCFGVSGQNGTATKGAARRDEGGRSDQQPCGWRHYTSLQEAFQVGVKKEGKKTTEGCDLNPPHTEFIQLKTFFVVVWSFSLMNHRPGRRKWIVCECAYFWEPLEWEFGIKSLKWAIWCFSNSEMALWCPWCVDGILSKAPLINLWVNLKSMISAFEIFIIIFHRFLSKLLWLDWL